MAINPKRLEMFRVARGDDHVGCFDDNAAFDFSSLIRAQKIVDLHGFALESLGDNRTGFRFNGPMMAFC